MRGDFQGEERFKDAADAHGKGKVDRCNLRKMYLTACKNREVRENISPRNHLAITSLTEPPVLPPLQGKRSVSAPPRTAAKAEQHTEALKDCLGAASTAFTAREVSGWCMCRRSCMSLAHLQLTLLR